METLTLGHPKNATFFLDQTVELTNLTPDPTEYSCQIKTNWYGDLGWAGDQSVNSTV